MSAEEGKRGRGRPIAAWRGETRSRSFNLAEASHRAIGEHAARHRLASDAEALDELVAVAVAALAERPREAWLPRLRPDSDHGA